MRARVFVVGLVVAGALVGVPGAASAAGGGALYGWGDNTGGQVGINWVTDGSHPVNQPVAVQLPADVVQAATVAGAGAAVRADGSVWVWGDSTYLHGDGGTGVRPAPHVVPGLPPIARLSLAWDAAVAVGQDGSLWAWGDNDYGKFGNGLPWTLQARPVRIAVSGVVDAAVGMQDVAYLDASGAVWTSGSNYSGELGNGTLTQRPGFGPALTPAGVTQVVATNDGFAALRSDGAVFVWGTQYGDVEVAAGRLPGAVPMPTRLDTLPAVAQLATGWIHTLGLAADGTVWAWGNNEFAQLGNGTADRDGPSHFTKTPMHTGLSGIARVVAADRGSGAVGTDGRLTMWGWNPGDRLGLGTTDQYVRTPVVKAGLAGVSVAVVGNTAFAVATSVTVVPRTVVPNVVGSTIPAPTLRSAGLTVGSTWTVPDDRYCNRVGEVKIQSPAAGTSVTFGSRVDITVYVLPSKPCL